MRYNEDAAGLFAENLVRLRRIGAVVFVLAVEVLLFGPPYLALASAYGVGGEPGTAAVRQCVEHGSGRGSRLECTGVFEMRGAAPEAEPIENVRLPSGRRDGRPFRAQIASDLSRAEAADLRGRLSALTVPALGVLALVPVPLWLHHLGGGERRVTARWIRRTGGVALAPAAAFLIGLLASLG